MSIEQNDRLDPALHQTEYLFEGDTLRFEDVISGENPGPPLHIHPKQLERFHVLEGSMSICLDGEERVLGAGESVEIAAGQAHTFHTKGSPGVRMIIELTPAGDMETFFRGIAKVERESLHPLLQLSVMYAAADEFGFFLVGPPVWGQKLVFSVLAPIARLIGYRA